MNKSQNPGCAFGFTKTRKTISSAARKSDPSHNLDWQHSSLIGRNWIKKFWKRRQKQAATCGAPPNCLSWIWLEKEKINCGLRWVKNLVRSPLAGSSTAAAVRRRLRG